MPEPASPSLIDRLLEKFRGRPHLLNKAAIMFGARGLGLAFAALGSVWAARCLGPRNFGISGMVQSLALFSGAFLAVIYPLVLVRDYKDAADDAARNRLIQVTNSYRLAVALLFCALAAVLLALRLEPPSFHFAGWFFLPILFLTALQPTWIFQAAEKQQFQSMLAVLQPGLVALYYAAIIRPGMSAGWDLLGVTLVTAVLTFIYWRAVFRLTHFRGGFFAWDGWGEIGRLILKSRWLFLFFLCTYVYNNLDQPLLGWLSSLEEQGKYRTAVRVTDAAQGFLTILPSIFFPRFIEWRKRGEEFFWRRQGRLLAFGTLAGAAAAVLCFLLIPLVYVPVFGNAYAQAAQPCAILVSAKIMDCLGQVYSLGLMTDHAYDKKVLAAGLLTAAVSLGSNLLFIPKFGMTTAACVNLLSETLMLVLCFGLSWRRIGQIQKSRNSVEGTPPPEKAAQK